MINFLVTFTLLFSSFETDLAKLQTGDQIPKDFATKYLNADPAEYGNSIQYEVRFKPEFGATDLPALAYNAKTGDCDQDYLVIFNKDGSIKSELKIFFRCDHDRSIATYKVWSFEIEPEESLIYLSIRGKQVKDKSLIDEEGKIIGNKNILQLETESFDKLEIYSVMEDGTISQLSI